ncbi:MAG: hypothetical protein HDR12_07600 [Lachnospiraceae bacterium]|nr:hypothetical protein [Lachnospiraceae bacterium]
MKRKFAIILACIMVVGVLGGCGNSFDASAYLKALLDNSYKNDSSQLVSMKIATAEEAAEIYEEGLDAEVKEIASAAGSLSAEQEEEYKKVFADVLAGAKYTVGDAEKQDDGSYVVTVTYEQMNVFEPAMVSYMDAVIAQSTEWQNAALNGEAVPSDDEMMDWIITTLKDSIAESLKSVTYDEPQTATVKISIVNNVWTPSTSDLANLEEVFFDLDDASAALQ